MDEARLEGGSQCAQSDPDESHSPPMPSARALEVDRLRPGQAAYNSTRRDGLRTECSRCHRPWRRRPTMNNNTLIPPRGPITSGGAYHRDHDRLAFRHTTASIQGLALATTRPCRPAPTLLHRPRTVCPRETRQCASIARPRLASQRVSLVAPRLSTSCSDVAMARRTPSIIAPCPSPSLHVAHAFR